MPRTRGNPTGFDVGKYTASANAPVKDPWARAYVFKSDPCELLLSDNLAMRLIMQYTIVRHGDILGLLVDGTALRELSLG